MFLEELSPLWRELTQEPVAFVGGFVAGAFRLDPAEDPLRSWLQRQGANFEGSGSDSSASDGNGGGPQSIAIE
ncbi:MAG: hypothetical protein BRC58_04070 [Cyanobacteria bacterium QS_8_64_29]|nr:MAG: hypothetical protein BRC58_04070 [Cyanobacteria bacterium QS_8_64_29]